MTVRFRVHIGFALLFSTLIFTSFACAQDIDSQGPIKAEAKKLSHLLTPVGSYFGIATQLCVPGDNTCPQVALFMTPTLNADGTFLGNDSLSLGGAPFGPHTTAHGQWVTVNGIDFVADYTFMLPGPPGAPSVLAPRFRWQAKVTDLDTIVGYVNISFTPPIPLKWSVVAADQFPTFPAEAQGVITPQDVFYTDPAKCTLGPACPLVFKFTVKRVTPNPF